MATALAIMGTVVSAVGSIATGQAQKQAADYQAAEYEVKAKEDAAVGQRDAQAYELQKQLAESTLQARAAGSAFSATDTNSLNLLKGIEGYGEEQAGVARYKGDSAAAGDVAQANAARLSGQAAVTGSYFSAAGTILGGFGSTMFSAYGAGLMPKSVAAPGYGAMSALFGYG